MEGDLLTNKHRSARPSPNHSDAYAGDCRCNAPQVFEPAGLWMQPVHSAGVRALAKAAMRPMSAILLIEQVLNGLQLGVMLFPDGRRADADLRHHGT